MTDARPVLGDVELQLVQKIDTDADQVLVRHDVPALEGDFLQRLGRRATRLTLTGVLTGPEAGDGLKTLRDKFRAAEPVEFVSDITTATRVSQVLIEEMGVRELAGKPQRFEYAFTLREYIPPPPVETEEIPPSTLDEELAEDGAEQVSEAVEDVAENAGSLTVQVQAENSTQDFTDLVVFIEGTTETGEEVYFTIEEQTAGVYTRENVPAGTYQVSIARR